MDALAPGEARLEDGGDALKDGAVAAGVVIVEGRGRGAGAVVVGLEVGDGGDGVFGLVEEVSGLGPGEWRYSAGLRVGPPTRRPSSVWEQVRSAARRTPLAWDRTAKGDAGAPGRDDGLGVVDFLGRHAGCRVYNASAAKGIAGDGLQTRS